MQRYISRPQLLTGLLVLLAATVFAHPGFSQTSPLFIVYDVQVKPGMDLEFENLIKNDLVPGLQKTGNDALFTWKTEFGQAGSYLLVTPVESLSELDKPDSLADVLGEKGLAYLLLRLNQTTYSPRIFMVNGRSDMGIEPQAGYQPKLAIMVKNTVAPGRQPDYVSNFKTMLAAMDKAGLKGLLSAQAGFGGKTNQFYQFALFDSFTDIENFLAAFEKSLQTAKLTPPVGISTDVEMTVMRFVPEMSAMPAAQSASR